MLDIFFIICKYFVNFDNLSINKLTKGSINETYKLNVNNNNYILQKINTKIFNDNVILDMHNVTNYLKQYMKVPKLLKYNNNELFITYEDNIYRIYDYIEGSDIDKTKLTNNMIYNLGRYLYNYHTFLKKYDYIPKHSIENFHNTQNYIDKITSLLNNYDNDIRKNIIDMIFYYDNNYDKLFDDKQLIHGDTRIENILQNEEEFILIDYDTIMIGSIYIDIGDLCRSLFTNLEDNSIKYNKEIHINFIKGYYNEKLGISYNVFENKCIKSALIICLELSIRFYIDYVEDYYFGYNEKKYSCRKDHNLNRANISYNLFKNIKDD
jgi:Ser/Thr protein kinase RdoA (MazF antagonist)